MNRIVEIFTDGACRGNPGPGGWGVLMRYKDKEKEIYGAEYETTNNRMELTAAIRGLQELKRKCRVRLTTDSSYLKNGITHWIEDWKHRNWRTAGKTPVKNADLWQQLDNISADHEIEWCWVRGHSGHRENEYADMLANRAIDELLNKV